VSDKIDNRKTGIQKSSSALPSFAWAAALAVSLALQIYLVDIGIQNQHNGVVVI